MFHSFKTEAVILSRHNVGEADKLLTLFTREFGKKVVIAKGIRRTHSRRAPHLELFSHAQLILHKGKRFDLVTEVESIEPFLHLRKKLERVAFVYIALELTSRMTAEAQESIDIFTQLLHFLQTLNGLTTTRKQAQQALIAFKQFMLEELGFMEGNLNISEALLDIKIETVLERTLKSPALLTNIQSGL